MAELIDGKKVSQELKDDVRTEVEGLKDKGIEPVLAVILVGQDPASTVYVNNKKKACEYTGIRSLSYELPEETTEEQVDNISEEEPEKVPEVVPETVPEEVTEEAPEKYRKASQAIRQKKHSRLKCFRRL